MNDPRAGATRYCDECGGQFPAFAVHRTSAPAGAALKVSRQLCRSCMKRDPDVARAADTFRSHMRSIAAGLRKRPLQTRQP